MNDPDAKPIFGEALRLDVAADRLAYLDQACAGNQALRREVESLLSAYEEAGDFLAHKPRIEPGDFPVERPGAMIGRYKLLEKIGEGGFGVVYMAEQQEPVQRRVALKIIKLGMDTKEVVARFEAERQALAMMDHPNIANVFDGGATATGRTYFVMELVKGVPITEYCDANKLSTRARLELFLQVCQAIQHAHQKGVIHRDLKPSNLLVSVKDDRPVPKIIDFGVAKATQTRLTQKTLFTRFQQWVGTPAYMSPEQAGLGSLDVDTRSDIYSLGVLLYELLTGRTPFDTPRLLEQGYDAIMRTIREDEPPKPSTRLSTLAPSDLCAVAARRSAEPDKLGRLLRGDLDWIVMKCLEKDRTRRYESATGLASDIGRHLNAQVITARPPTTGYLLARLIRRHRVGVAAGTAIACSLLIGSVVSTWEYFREKASRQRAVAAERAQNRLRQQAEIEAYSSQMSMAGYWASSGGSLGSVDNLLSRWRAHRPDLRGWEWYYLNGLTHRERLRIVADDLGLRAVAWSPDGKRIASAGADRRIKLWSALTGGAIRIFEGHADDVSGLAWSPDGKHLASASWDKTVRVWDAEAGTQLFTCRGHSDRVFTVAWSPDGSMLASGSKDRTVRIWNASSGAELQSFEAQDRVYCVGWNRTGTCVASSGEHDPVQVWDLRTKLASSYRVNLDQKSEVSRNSALAWSPNNAWFAVGCVDSRVRILDAATGQRITTLSNHENEVVSVAWNPQSTRLAGASRGDGEIDIWEAPSWELLASFCGHLGAVPSVSWSPDGAEIASGGTDGTIRIWPVNPTDPVHTVVRRPGQALSVAWHPAGSFLAQGTSAGSVWVWDTRRMTQPTRIPAHHGWVWRVAWNPAGTRLATGASDGRLRVWQWPSSQELWSADAHSQEVRALAWSPDGARLASRGADSILKIWEGATGALTEQFEMEDPGTVALAWSPDGRYLVTSARNRIIVLDFPGGRTRWRIPGHPELVRDLAWSPDGRRFASVSTDTTVKIWDLATGKCVSTLLGHVNEVKSVAWSPDGSRLATGSWDGTLKIRDPAHAQLLCSLGGSGLLSSVAWSPDGKRIASGNLTGEVWIRDCTLGEQVEKKR